MIKGTDLYQVISVFTRTGGSRPMVRSWGLFNSEASANEKSEDLARMWIRDESDIIYSEDYNGYWRLNEYKRDANGDPTSEMIGETTLQVIVTSVPFRVGE